MIPLLYFSLTLYLLYIILKEKLALPYASHILSQLAGIKKYSINRKAFLSFLYRA